MTPPPLGTMPRCIWEGRVRSQRINELLDAIQRYVAADCLPDMAWVKELRDLITENSFELAPAANGGTDLEKEK